MKDKIVTVRYKPEDYERVKRAAEKLGIKPSVYIRMRSLEDAPPAADS